MTTRKRRPRKTFTEAEPITAVDPRLGRTIVSMAEDCHPVLPSPAGDHQQRTT